ncbi:hypothetical protein PYCCODRAFT_1465227 [Trametes coccinea BRFM310]|uniref:Uncharacterized protein n=1 Tax=Trametes coccinea (strain BRFM310) TaxID=1353009 RepID=A0A1Y2IVZ3_TRAC3|nr:hypothetical protein PYCCODRAFT_1465227 [Trametes coccinea BRFM310]
MAPPQWDEPEKLFAKVARVATVSAYVARNLHDSGDNVGMGNTMVWLAMIKESLSEVEAALGIQGGGIGDACRDTPSANQESANQESSVADLVLPSVKQRAPSGNDSGDQHILSGSGYSSSGYAGYAAFPRSGFASKPSTRSLRTAHALSMASTSRVHSDSCA